MLTVKVSRTHTIHIIIQLVNTEMLFGAVKCKASDNFGAQAPFLVEDFDIFCYFYLSSVFPSNVLSLFQKML